ncbi:hypothetical protein CHCC20441_4438 [Bacillus licheniformis]|nr:hypothetical protein CHCC20441_4438 [Bacillus licheniformis]TWL80009.1 hypothetical protein CHCC15315_0157 [Bacillus licheniformis]TWN15899.1 hypothetical protein CHCC14564_0464 [Bacillus licheniformis LMG 17339]
MAAVFVYLLSAYTKKMSSVFLLNGMVNFSGIASCDFIYFT